MHTLRENDTSSISNYKHGKKKFMRIHGTLELQEQNMNQGKNLQTDINDRRSHPGIRAGINTINDWDRDA